MDNQTEKKGGKGTVLAWLCVLAACMVSATPNYAQNQLAPLAASIMGTFNISQAQFTTLFVAPNMPGIFLSFIAGLLLDKLGSKRVIFVAILLTTIGCFLRIIVSNYPSFFGSMVLIGLTSSFIVSGASKVMSNFFPVDKIGLPLGLFYAFASAAMFIAQATSAMFDSARSAFIVATIISAIALAMWAIIIPSDKKMGSASVEKRADEEDAPKISELLKSVLGSWKVWAVTIAMVCVGALGFAIQANLASALATRGLDEVSSGLMSSLISAGMIVGSIVVPAIANKVHKEKACVIICLIITAITSLLIMSAPIGFALGLIIFIFGFALFGVIPIIVSTPIRLPEIGVRKAATAGGVITTIQSIGIFLLPGYVLVPLSGGSFATLFMICGILALVGAAVMLPVKIPKSAQ